MQEVDELENIILSKVTWAQMLYILSHMWILDTNIQIPTFNWSLYRGQETRIDSCKLWNGAKVWGQGQQGTGNAWYGKV